MYAEHVHGKLIFLQHCFILNALLFISHIFVTSRQQNYNVYYVTVFIITDQIPQMFRYL